MILMHSPSLRVTSIPYITLVLAVEKEFGLKLNTAEVGGLENVGRMIELLMLKATK
jgi:acyl carrier protein